MAYKRVNWKDRPNVNTPVDAEHLNIMDKGIADLDSQLAQTASRDKVNDLQSQINTIVLDGTSGDSSAEVAQARINTLGETFTTTKEHLDNIESVLQLKGNIYNQNDTTYKESGYYYSNMGIRNASANYTSLKQVPVNKGDIIYLTGVCGVSTGLISAINGHDADGVFVSALLVPSGISAYTNVKIVVPDGIKFINCSFRTSDNPLFKLAIYPNVTNILGLNYEPIKRTKIDEIMSPVDIYTVINDYDYKRNYFAEVYQDHCLKSSIENDLVFTETGKDRIRIGSMYGNDPYSNYPYISQTQVAPLVSVVKNFNLQSEHYTGTISIKHRSLKASVGTGKKAFILCVGDSVSQYAMYSLYAAELFAMDKIDNANAADVCFLGGTKSLSTRRTSTLTYKGNTKTIKGFTEGINSWSLMGHLRKSSLMGYNQTVWDNLGLGDGTHMDYAGTDAQIRLINNTPDVNTSENPTNPFYDNNKPDIKFSIVKWLERFRTMDDSGKRLYGVAGGQAYYDSAKTQIATGYTIGTQVTDTTAFDVCKPTHVILAHGKNGLATDADYCTYIQQFIDTVKSEIPGVYIGIGFGDMCGSFYPDRYPQVLDADDKKYLAPRDDQYNRQKALKDFVVERQTENVFYLPFWFVQPTGLGWGLRKVDRPHFVDNGCGETNYYIYYDGGASLHPGDNSHSAWAYQLYGWILRTFI